MFNLCKIVLFLACLFEFSADAQVQDQTRVENFPLSANSPVNCDTIVDTHTFKGDCCSLNVTQGDGCVLNVINGQCIIRGQYFSLDFTSTDTTRDCPPGEYTSEDLGLTDPPTPAPISASASVASGFASLAVISAFLLASTGL